MSKKFLPCGYTLRSCVWEITLACCFSCAYCGSRAGASRENVLSTEECLDVARQLGEMGCRRISLIGGEVFMRRDWEQIVEVLTGRNISVNIITNGFLLSKELLDRVKKLRIESVSVSVDGPGEIHDAFREKGSFARAMLTIDVLTESGIPVSVITTLHSKNVDGLEELYEILKQKKIFAWQIQACSPMGNASDPRFSTSIDFQKVIDFVEKHHADPSFAIGTADNIGYYTEEEGHLRGGGIFRGCTAGLTSIGIDSIGNVRGCESMYDDYFIEGNLRNRSLYEIWNDPNAFSYNRQFTEENLSGQCKQCAYGNQCAGGCRSYNYFTHGKLYESLYCARNHNP